MEAINTMRTVREINKICSEYEHIDRTKPMDLRTIRSILCKIDEAIANLKIQVGNISKAPESIRSFLASIEGVEQKIRADYEWAFFQEVY